MKEKPNLSFWGLWNLSFGFFGVQIAYSLQSANIARIFATLGADPHSLSYFWILPPLMGMIVQPIVGTLSDKTWWGRLGRRIPYLLIGATIAVIVMSLLPNAGSFGMTVSTAMVFGLIMLMFLDTSLNMAMQPFKMLVGDMVNEKQKSLAYSIQSFLVNAGSVLGFVFPFLLTWLGIKNSAAKGVVPDSVILSFYLGAAILILCVIYSVAKIREWNPKKYEEYNGSKKEDDTTDDKSSGNWIALLRHAPATFWRVSLVQFFCWAAFLYMWTYTNGSIADTVWGVDMADPNHVTTSAYQEAGNWVGILFGVQAIGAVVWAMMLPRFKSRKMAYAVSLIIGGIGFASVPFMGDKYMLFISFALIGCAWAAMMAMPFTFVTNALQGYGHMGAYLGLFNCAICLPQIIAAATGGSVLSLLGSHQYNMMIAAGVFLVLGALAVTAIKEK